MSRKKDRTRIQPAPAAAPKGGARMCFVALTGDVRGTRFEIHDGVNRVGRGAEADIRLATDEYVSRLHANFVLKEGTVVVRDLYSTNGTYVNGERVTSMTLRNGDRVHIGTTAMKCLFADDVEAAYLEEMYRMATRDGLTDLYNKRYLLEQLDKKLSETRRSGVHLAVLLADIDHFKKINDQHGHVAGDQVLQEIAKVGSAALRKEDIFARFGGEEFSILAPRTDAEAAKKLAEKFRRGVAEMRISFSGKRISVTTSVGVWSGIASREWTSEEALRKADQALYQAKHEGRDRCIVGS
ncbi:MAG: GGDEF domain-containing protein [Nitrospirae bacterium]|nr:GGDEF domain-containing protein [Nitrospirota bacterium]